MGAVPGAPGQRRRRGAERSPPWQRPPSGSAPRSPTAEPLSVGAPRQLRVEAAGVRAEPTRRSLTILPFVATMLTARLSRPLSQLPRKTLNFSDRENGTRGSLLLYSAPFVPVGRRTYAASVDPVGSKAVLITGCDSGFGFSLAKHLHSEGFLVFAGCLMKMLKKSET